MTIANSLAGAVMLEPTPPGWTVTLRREGRADERRGFIARHAAFQYAVGLAEREGVPLVERYEPSSRRLGQ